MKDASAIGYGQIPKEGRRCTEGKPPYRTKGNNLSGLQHYLILTHCMRLYIDAQAHKAVCVARNLQGS